MELPNELEWNIMKFMRHPVAELFVNAFKNRNIIVRYGDGIHKEFGDGGEPYKIQFGKSDSRQKRFKTSIYIRLKFGRKYYLNHSSRNKHNKEFITESETESETDF